MYPQECRNVSILSRGSNKRRHRSSDRNDGLIRVPRRWCGVDFIRSIQTNVSFGNRRCWSRHAGSSLSRAMADVDHSRLACDDGAKLTAKHFAVLP